MSDTPRVSDAEPRIPRTRGTRGRQPLAKLLVYSSPEPRSLPQTLGGDRPPTDDLTVDASLPLAPRARGLPVVGSLFALRRDPLAALVEMYRRLGPIFEIRALHRRFTVLAGRDANEFLAVEGERYLGSERLFGGMARELGTDAFLVALDGRRHRHLRRQMARGYSKSALAPHVADMVELVDELTRSWRPGDIVPVLPFFQRVVTDQLGQSLAARRPGDVFDSLRYFLRVLMNVEVMKTWPRWVLRLPAYRRAKRMVFAFVEEVLRDHLGITHKGTAPTHDLIDDILGLRDLDGQPLQRDAIVAAAIGPFIAGIDTVASSLSFISYGILKHPDVIRAVQGDADRALSSDDIFSELRSFEMLHAAILESLRLWPVAPFTPRVALRPFAFAGHRVERGTDILVAQAVTHCLGEFFPEPKRFDLERHLEPRRETRRPLVFAPYSLGTHRCLGAGQAEVQMMVTIATLLNRFELALAEPSSDITVRATPIPSPGRRFSLRVVRRRG